MGQSHMAFLLYLGFQLGLRAIPVTLVCFFFQSLYLNYFTFSISLCLSSFLFLSCSSRHAHTHTISLEIIFLKNQVSVLKILPISLIYVSYFLWSYFGFLFGCFFTFLC